MTHNKHKWGWARCVLGRNTTNPIKKIKETSVGRAVRHPLFLSLLLIDGHFVHTIRTIFVTQHYIIVTRMLNDKISFVSSLCFFRYIRLYGRVWWSIPLFLIFVCFLFFTSFNTYFSFAEIQSMFYYNGNYFSNGIHVEPNARQTNAWLTWWTTPSLYCIIERKEWQSQCIKIIDDERPRLSNVNN